MALWKMANSKSGGGGDILLRQKPGDKKDTMPKNTRQLSQISDNG